MKIIKKSYNQSYFNTGIDKLPFKKKFNKIKVDLIRSIKPSGKLLEVGCGRGELLDSLKRYYSVFGIDISSSAIIEASKALVRNNLEIADIEKEDIHGKYDIILAFDVLEHLRNPSKTILKIKKALNRNGIFIFSVPNNYGMFGKFATSFFNYTDKTHVSAYKRSQWIDILKNAGFGIDIRNQHFFGISKSGISKHFSFNLLIIAKLKK